MANSWAIDDLQKPIFSLKRGSSNHPDLAGCVRPAAAVAGRPYRRPHRPCHGSDDGLVVRASHGHDIDGQGGATACALGHGVSGLGAAASTAGVVGEAARLDEGVDRSGSLASRGPPRRRLGRSRQRPRPPPMTGRKGRPLRHCSVSLKARRDWYIMMNDL